MMWQRMTDVAAILGIAYQTIHWAYRRGEVRMRDQRVKRPNGTWTKAWYIFTADIDSLKGGN